MLWLLLGLLRVSPWEDIAAYMLYVVSFSLTAYLLFKKVSFIKDLSIAQLRLSSKYLRYFILITATLFPFLHWIQLGHVPVISAFATGDYWETTLIRQRIFENAGAFWRYGASLNVIAIMPFLVLLFFIKHSRWFWCLAFFALAYAVSLMQKSHVIVVFLPTIIYALQNRNIRIASSLALLSLVGIVTLILATNPSLRPDIDLISKANAAPKNAVTTSGTVDQGKWTAYGEPFMEGVPGRFKSSAEALYFDGSNAVYLDRADSQYEIGRDDFSIEFWVFPLVRPVTSQIITLYWNGAASGDPWGSSHITYEVRPDGTTFIQFNVADRSAKSSFALISKNEVKLNQWNHVYVARSGHINYLGLNGSMVRGNTVLDDLSLNEGVKGLVQFGARFAGEYRQADGFFKGYIDEIAFSKSDIKYTDDYVVPSNPSPVKSLTLRDIAYFEAAPRALAAAPGVEVNWIPGPVRSLFHRIVLVPGEVVGQWFAVIPSEHPFAYGCGYRPLAKLIGCSHVNFSERVYASYNKYLIEKGISGTMNAASFMEDYANFGLPGLIFSGILLAGLVYVIGLLFAGRRRLGVALNAVPLLYLSSGGLLPLLLSGGWLATILLYVFFYEELNNNCPESDVCAV